MTPITIGMTGSAFETAINANFNEQAGALVVSLTDDSIPTYVYYGGLFSTAWKINRYHRTTFVKTSATIANNSGVATLSAAWAARTTLTYA